MSIVKCICESLRGFYIDAIVVVNINIDKLLILTLSTQISAIFTGAIKINNPYHLQFSVHLGSSKGPILGIHGSLVKQKFHSMNFLDMRLHIYVYCSMDFCMYYTVQKMLSSLHRFPEEIRLN